MDIGTTYSGVSYCLLDPGVVPEIKQVTRFPAQERIGSDAKIPSIIYYDRDGNVKAIGAEAEREGIIEMAEDQGWDLSKWFKLHLRPENSESSSSVQTIHPLPPNKSAVTVLSDFIRYLMQCTKSFIIQSMPDGASFWESVEDNIQFVLSHPNGWEGAQQSQMRRAAIQAGLISGSREDYGRIQFVTEGEASLHYCLNNGCNVSRNGGIVIVDAGGGTVDLSTYAKMDTKITTFFKEISRPQCHFTGSIFVTFQARQYLQSKLANSHFLEDIDHICQCFDRTTKFHFKNPDEMAFIKFGTTRDKDPNVGIRSGQMKIPGKDVAKFFEPSINSIMKAIVSLLNEPTKEVNTAFLVGGFAASDYLFNKLADYLQPTGLQICRPQNHLNKAVADGAVSFYLDHFVTCRIARWHYGVRMNKRYDKRDPEHMEREHTAYINVGGMRSIPDGFDIILPKDTDVAETIEFRGKEYVRRFKDETYYKTHSLVYKILCYRGKIQKPKWTDVDAENFFTLCSVEADASQIPVKPQLHQGQVHYSIGYSIILLFGLTELKAQIAWSENGIEKRGPAQIVYDDDWSAQDD
ncbi:hypothetical protein VKT23_000249 [Stygiomarasmius scandens]|uniref:Uncharacterized protein n=1 Tax=Marasmiellus scandens TaxID=2682957 RepID=A0ABR1K7G1_9AGAR